MTTEDRDQGMTVAPHCQPGKHRYCLADCDDERDTLECKACGATLTVSCTFDDEDFR